MVVCIHSWCPPVFFNFTNGDQQLCTGGSHSDTQNKRWTKKVNPKYSTHNFVKYRLIFKVFFTLTIFRKFAMQQSLNIPLMPQTHRYSMLPWWVRNTVMCHLHIYPTQLKRMSLMPHALSGVNSHTELMLHSLNKQPSSHTDKWHG